MASAQEFRRLALQLPGASESVHFGTPDFRVGRKIFATLGWPADGWAMVKLPPDEQEMFVAAEPTVFVPVRGGWGLRGSTNVRLEAADEPTLRSALRAAWQRIAPRRLLAGGIAGSGG